MFGYQTGLLRAVLDRLTAYHYEFAITVGDRSE